MKPGIILSNFKRALAPLGRGAGKKKNPHQVCLKLPSFPCVHHQRSLSYLLSMHAEVS